MYVFAITAVVDDRPVAAWLLASDNDEASAKASAKLPEGGKLAHVIQVCPATLSNLQRNKLLSFVPMPDAIEFTSKAVLEVIQIQAQLNQQLSEAIDQLTFAIKNQIPPPTPEDNEP